MPRWPRSRPGPSLANRRSLAGSGRHSPDGAAREGAARRKVMLRRLAFWLLFFLVFTVPWEYLYRVDDMTMVSRAVGVVVAGVWALAALAAGRLRPPGTLLVLMALFVAW